MPSFRSHVTLALCTLLHAFTHAYGTILVPLYLLMKDDLRLRGVWQASLVVPLVTVDSFRGSGQACRSLGGLPL